MADRHKLAKLYGGSFSHVVANPAGILGLFRCYDERTYLDLRPRVTCSSRSRATCCACAMALRWIGSRAHVLDYGKPGGRVVKRVWGASRSARVSDVNIRKNCNYRTIVCYK